MRIDPDEKLIFYYKGHKQVDVVSVITDCMGERGHDLVDVYNEFLIDVYMILDRLKSRYIALDWDNTVSADQDFFRELIKKLQRAGYSPFICTLRAPDRENIKEICEILDEAMIPIYLTDGKPKRRYMKKLGVKVHLWIDDFYPAVCGDKCKILKRNMIE